MTDYEQLRAALDKKLAADPSLRAVMKRVKNGAATLTDSAEYARVLSHILGREVSASILELDDRESAVTQLLHDSYDDVNSIYAQTQSILDEQAGIHITPKKPSFSAERVEQFVHSLVDPTVKDSVIKRRARAGTETITKSFHDNCIKVNAQFRHDAGLKCYIVRIGTKCCEWCTEVAGKYKFGEQPDGIFRRHDNCDCTIIYDGQVLRGKQNADGSRSKTWEELPNANAADYTAPTLPESEGRAIEQRNLAQIRGLTSGTNGGKIRNIEIGDINTAIKDGTIQKDVAKTIIDTLSESNSQSLFDNVTVIRTDPKIVMQTDPVKKGTFFDTRLNLNENFLGGKSVKEIDAELKNSDFTVANSLREAVIHEKYHAKLISGLNQDQLEALYDILSDYHIDGISKTAWKDGSECIAEIGVLFERGETDDLPQQAKDLFNKYIGGIP